MMDQLKQLQEQLSQKYKMNVDVYCTESKRKIAVFPAGSVPIPPSALEVIYY